MFSQPQKEWIKCYEQNPFFEVDRFRDDKMSFGVDVACLKSTDFSACSTRALLCQIVGIKMCMFDTYKFRSQTAEEYLRTFLENEVKVLWPQGWIQTRLEALFFSLPSFYSPVSLSLSLLPLPHAAQYVNMEIKVPSTLILERRKVCFYNQE